MKDKELHPFSNEQYVFEQAYIYKNSIIMKEMGEGIIFDRLDVCCPENIRFYFLKS